MFTVYHSNQLDVLQKLAATLMKSDPLKSVLQPEILLVQSDGMAKWLQMQLADELNIAANMTFLRPSQFIWQIYHQVLNNIPERSAFEKDSMSWKLMEILPDLLHLPEFSSLARYIDSNEKEKKYYQLASRIADLYDSYLMYRPEWIKQWEQGKVTDKNNDDEIWQATLWCRLVAHTNELSQSLVHRGNISQDFVAALEKKIDASLLAKLPSRLFIFGIASLPPLILRSLFALGQHIDIHLMLTNPCRWYWGEIPDEKWLNRLAQQQWQRDKIGNKRSLLKPSPMPFKSMENISMSNPLLSSWGKLGRDNLFLLQDYPLKQDIEAFVCPDSDSILQLLQQQILDLEDKSIIGHHQDDFETSHKKMSVPEGDYSISFHSCHSESTEVEVLYNYLLELFDHNPSLQLRDIVVMVPDIDTYAPHINAVFGSAPENRYLPFSISDRKINTVDPIARAFLSLLDLPASRFTTEEVFDLLAVPAISRQFTLTEKELKQLREWSVSAGVRWGLDDEMVNAMGIDNGGHFTWDFGLARMLLGYVMNSEWGDWNTILPFDSSSGLAAELVGKLAVFLSTLSRWYRFLSTDKTLEEWLPIGSMLLNDFFYKDSESDPMMMLLENEWQRVIDQGIRAGYRRAVSIVTLQNKVCCGLENTRLEQSFLVGKITFCTLMPMRGIPFQVVCLLGMNDRTYPRRVQSLSFDLLNQRPQRGDRSRREDDRYLFLEAVLSAQATLYISYLGNNIIDNSETYPSILVDELRDYLSQSFVLEGDKPLNIDESAKNFKAHLTIHHPRTPFHENNYIIDKKRYQIGSYFDEWLPAAKKQGVATCFEQTLSPLTLTSITLDELKRFYRHPVRALLQKRLNVFFSLNDEALPTTEVFQLKGLARYWLNQELLSQMTRHDASIDTIVKRFKAEGKLPYGVFGDLDVAQEYEKIAELAKRLLAEKGPSQTHEVNLTFHEISLEGWLMDVQPDGLLRAKPGELTAADGMDLWLEHLVITLTANHDIKQSRLYGINGSTWQFMELSKDQAYQILSELIEGFLSGMHKPLILPIKSAWQWIDMRFDTASNQLNVNDANRLKGRDKLIRTWRGNDIAAGECDDYYFRLVPELTESHVDEIEQAATRFLLPMKQARSD